MNLYHYFICAGMLLVVVGCGESAGPERVAVQGVISVDGTPLRNGAITFVPTEGTGGPKASAKIVHGSYELEASRGPVVGTHRVEIRAEQELGFALDDPEDFDKHALETLPPNPIPPQFNQDSVLTFEAKSGIKNHFGFAIRTK